MKWEVFCYRVGLLISNMRQKKSIDRYRSRLKLLYHFFGEDTVFYINGAEVLPAPLEPAKEAQLLEDLKSDNEKISEKAKNILVERNLRLVVYIAKRFDNTRNRY